jgi:hypothetical protein
MRQTDHSSRRVPPNVASKNEEAKSRYRAVENTTKMGCNARKTNKQTFRETKKNISH